jgi:aryl-phospho-beta-D-glucosidase BglC (GH1 family)
MVTFPAIFLFFKLLFSPIEVKALPNLDPHQLKKVNYSKEVIVADPKNASTWKGVNLTLQINQPNAKDLIQGDFDFAAQAGANVIRLVINADPKKKNSSSFFDSNGTILPATSSSGIKDIEQASAMAKKADLKLILDMSTMPGSTTNEIGKDFSSWEKLKNLWLQIALVFKDDNTVIAFDLMNEPGLIRSIPNPSEKSSVSSAMAKGNWAFPQDWKNTARDYKTEMTKLMKAIRGIDANRTLIVEGYGLFGQPINFKWLQPVEGLDNIVYSFHMYIPPTLTMIGTSGFEGRGTKPKPFIYPKDVTLIDKAFGPVLEFQKKYNVPIYVGEFGVTDQGIFESDPNGIPYNAACWLTTVINKMNEYKWGWTYWSFWTEGRKPKSTTDPRYIILNAAMRGESLKSYCK